jgi:hypothetical protein
LVEEAGGVACGVDGSAVFPFDGSLQAAAERPLRLVTGSEAVVQQVTGELAKLPI